MKKVIMGVVAVAMCAFTGFSEEAESIIGNDNAAVFQAYALEAPADEEVMPAYTFNGIYEVYAQISRSSNTVTCTSIVDFTQDPTVSKIELKQHLQYFSAPNWVNLTSKSKDYYTNEKFKFVNTYNVPSGHNYRTVTQVKIYCASGPLEFAVASIIV